MTSLPCDIVILPSDELARVAIAFSERLQQFNTLFTLKEGAYFPHASLYMTQIKVADLDKVKELLSSIAAGIPQLDLIASGYYQAEGYIDPNYTRTKTLDQLQMTVVNAINPIRDGMREKDKARLASTSGKIRENLEKYGYRGVGDLFRPHMTLTRFADGQPIDESSLPDIHRFDGKFIKLGLFEMGDNGTCVRKIADFKLGTGK